MHVSSASDREGFASVGDGVLGLEALGSRAGDPKLSRPAGVYFELQEGTLSRKDLARLCWGNCYEKICASANLAVFLKKARERNGYAFGG